MGTSMRKSALWVVLCLPLYGSSLAQGSASWEPRGVRLVAEIQLRSDEILGQGASPNLVPRLDFVEVTEDGKYVFVNLAKAPIYILIIKRTGEWEQFPSPPPMYEPGYDVGYTGNMTHPMGAGWLIALGRPGPHFLLDGKGRLVNSWDTVSRRLVKLPDETYLSQEENRGHYPQGNCKAEIFMEMIHKIYDGKGNYLRMLNRPPGMLFCYQGWPPYAVGDCEGWVRIYPGKAQCVRSEAGKMAPSGSLYYGENKLLQGIKWGGKWAVFAESRQKSLCTNPPGGCQVRFFADYDGTMGFMEQTPTAIRFFSTEEPVEYQEPPEVIKEIPLDGFGYPPETSPARGAPPYYEDEAGRKYHFAYGEQEIPLWGKAYPVYDLWDFCLSKQKHDCPEEILGLAGWNIRDSKTGELKFQRYDEVYYELDLRKLPAEVRVRMQIDSRKPYTRETWSAKLIDYVLTPQGYEKTLPKPHEFWTKNQTYAMDVKYKNLAHPGDSWAYELDPTRPDVIEVNPGYFEVFSRRLIETGPDTKVFVCPRLTLRLTLLGKDLPPNKKSRLRALCWNWPDKRNYVHLEETAPGSCRFTNEDGSVVYELAYVMDEVKKLTERPDGETLNYLYFYVTDKKLGLERFPQIIYETGIDTGFYRSWYEPSWNEINLFRGQWHYKPWNQIEEELEKVRFHVEVSGPGVSEGAMLRVSWEEPGSGARHSDIPLEKCPEGSFRTRQPLISFSLTGCDIGNTWQETEKISTPQIPGVVTFRDKNVKWEVVPSAPSATYGESRE